MSKNYNGLKSTLYGAKAVCGYTLDDLASATGIGRRKICELMKAPENIKLQELDALAKVLKIDDSALSAALFANG